MRASSIPAIAMLAVAGSASPPAETSSANRSPRTEFLVRPEGRIAYDDTGGTGPLVIAIPGMWAIFAANTGSSGRSSLRQAAAW